MIKAVLFDVEGTLVKDKRYLATEGAAKCVNWMREQKLALCLITNNTTHKPPEIIYKLANTGLEFSAEELVTCPLAATTILRQRAVKRCFVLGSDKLKQMLGEGGLTVTEETDVDAVVVGLDQELTYAKLQQATEALVEHNALLVALHQNRIARDQDGRVGPSVGPTVAALAYAANTEPLVVGKPSAEYYQLALDKVKTPAQEVLVISDDPFSDLAGAKQLGMQAAFVLVGKYADPRILQKVDPPLRPDLVVEHLGKLVGHKVFNPTR